MAQTVPSSTWLNSDSIIGSIIMSLDTLLGFIRVIQRSMRLEDRS